MDYTKTNILLGVLVIISVDMSTSHLPSTGDSYWNQRQSRCVSMPGGICSKVSYNMTQFPNALGTSNSEDARREFHHFLPLVKVGCSDLLEQFLCSIYFPMCTILETPLPVCKTFCQRAVTACVPLLNKFGLDTPAIMNCDQYPQSMCVDIHMNGTQYFNDQVVPITDVGTDGTSEGSMESTEAVSLELEVYPSFQKIAEQSPAVFTCVSSESDGIFTWYRGSRPVDEVNDAVSIKMIADNISVMRVDSADIKTHKKTYKCRFETNDGRFEDEEAELRVLPKSRLHKYFPHIDPITSADSVMLSAPPGGMSLRCPVSNRKSTYTWRWIKDSYEDIVLTGDDMRVVVNDEGELTIRDVTSADSGMYMCVAENNRGTGYSSQFRVAVVQDSSGCTDKSGYRSQIGESYTLPDDICTTCSCDTGGMLRCRSITCMPGCPMGKLPKMSEDECCVYDCLPQTAFDLDTILEDHTCTDKDGKLVYSGQFYTPDVNDPCKSCLCLKNRENACTVVDCVPPNCPGFRMVPGTCCEFICPAEIETKPGSCVDRDGMSVMPGSTYMPEEDPCIKCECENGRRGRCMMVACTAPTCENFTPSRDECCKYTCTDDDQPPMPEFPRFPDRIQGGCVDFSGRPIKVDDMYQRDEDPCKMCQCPSTGEPEMCHQVTCDEPTCRNYIIIPGTCCGFKCPDEDDVDEVSIDLTSPSFCRAYDGAMVQPGALFNPTSDPCYTCRCDRFGVPRQCHMIQACTPPAPSTNNSKILGRIVMQQIGRNDAIVQWSVPEGHEGKSSEFTVSYSDMSTDTHHSTRVQDEMFLILRDLNLYTVYDIQVEGMIDETSFSAIPMPFRFTLQPQGHSGMALNNALGQVFISRGSIQYEGYSLPREFEPVGRVKGVDMLVNVRGFHMAELSTYNETPCPDQDCGLIRFYMYNVNGESQNVMSLMFASQQDFMWAKAYL